jgi:hypothetical protein
VLDLVRGIFAGWDRFWFSKVDPTTLGLMRICFGLVVFYIHLTYSWELFSYVGPEAWVDQSVANYVLRDIPVFRLTSQWGDNGVQIASGSYFWSIFFHATSAEWIISFHVFFLVCMLLFTAGLWTRWTAALSWVGASCYVHRASSTVYGVDTMIMIALLYLLIAPSGATLSMDRWLEKWRARRRGQLIPPVEPSYSANFATRLIQVHFCIIYLATGTSKLLGTTWWSGTALNVVMLNPSFAPMDNALYFRAMKFLASHRPLWETVMTAGIAYTLLVEISFAFLVWDQRWRWVMVCCSIGLHTGIGLFMGLTTFSLLMMVMVLSFIPPEQVRALLESLEDALSRRLAKRAGVQTRNDKREPLALKPATLS